MLNFTKRGKVIVGLVAGVLAVAMALAAVSFRPASEASAGAGASARSGAQTIEFVDPIHDRSLTASFWPPSGGDRSHLVVLSHGFGGDRTSHSYLGEELALEGYAVVAPTHPDLAGLESGDDGLDPLILRPRHLALAIDAAELQTATVGSFDHITVIGHSLGGYSALRVIGAEASISGVERHCSANGADPILCPSQAWDRFEALTAHEPGNFDERVDRVVLLAPGYGPLFAVEELTVIDLPILVLKAAKDRELVGHQVDDLVSRLPTGTQARTIDGGHFDFVRQCSAEESTAMPEVCASEQGIDRQAVHEHVLDEITAFLAGGV